MSCIGDLFQLFSVLRTLHTFLLSTRKSVCIEHLDHITASCHCWRLKLCQCQCLLFEWTEQSIKTVEESNVQWLNILIYRYNSLSLPNEYKATGKWENIHAVWRWSAFRFVTYSQNSSSGELIFKRVSLLEKKQTNMNIKNRKPHLIKANFNCGSKNVLFNSKAIPFFILCLLIKTSSLGLPFTSIANIREDLCCNIHVIQKISF